MSYELLVLPIAQGLKPWAIIGIFPPLLIPARFAAVVGILSNNTWDSNPFRRCWNPFQQHFAAVVGILSNNIWDSNPYL